MEKDYVQLGISNLKCLLKSMISFLQLLAGVSVVTNDREFKKL